MEKGKICFSQTIEEIRENAKANLNALPEKYHTIDEKIQCPVEIHENLTELIEILKKQYNTEV